MCDVNVATGEVTQYEFDVLLSGRVPWELTRSYSSRNLQPGLVGVGWKVNLGSYLQPSVNGIELIINGAPVAALTLPPRGRSLTVDSPQLEVIRTHDRIDVRDGTLARYVFPDLDVLTDVVPCSAQYDHFGNVIFYQHDAQLRLTALVDTFGRHLLLGYDSHSRLARVTLRGVHDLVRYEYDQHGDLVAVVDPLGHSTRYEYEDHLLTRMTDRAGRDLCYQYDAAHRCIRTWFTGGVWDRALSFDTKRNRVLVTDPLGYQTLYEKNADEIIVRETDALGSMREDVLDQAGRVVMRTRSDLAAPESILVSADGRSVVTARNGQKTTFQLDNEGRPVKMTDPAGGNWEFGYDEAGNDTLSRSPHGATWRFVYDSNGDLIRSIDPLGHERTRQRSADRIVMYDSVGLVEDARFDALGRNVAYYDALGKAVQTELDDCGNPVVTRYPDNTVTRIEFDGEGDPTRIVDELGRESRFERNEDETLISMIRPDGHTESFRFSRREELIEIANASGEVATIEYDAEGRSYRIVYFDGRVESFEFDGLDNPVTVSDGVTGEALGWAEYDHDDLIREWFPDGRDAHAEYNERGEIVQLRNNDVRLEYEWDAESKIVVAQSDQARIEYEYDLRGDCTSVLADSGRRLEYEWDSRQRLTRVTDSGAWTYHFTYDVRNLVTELVLPNRCRQQFLYDALHRMVERRVLRPDGSALVWRRFHYDAAGRLTAYDDSARGQRRFEYDGIDFLTAIHDEPGGIEPWPHDRNGNVIRTPDGRAVTYGRGDRAIRVGDESREYDRRGNLVGISGPQGDSRFEYTGEGWLRSAQLPDGTTLQFEYDALARRTAKIVNGQRTTYTWDGVHLFAEASPGRSTDYLFLPGSFFVVGTTYEGRHYSYVLDHLGTPTELLDDGGNVVWAGDYTAYGQLRQPSDGRVPQPIRFQGQYCDAELGWHYARYRYYDPTLGRFTCTDPLGLNGGLNLYAYAPNPINWVDPFGLVHVTVNGNTATCEILSKCSWGTKTKAEARKKITTFNKAKCQVDKSTNCERESGYKEEYINDRSNGNAKKKAALTDKLADKDDPCKSIQVDHIKDVQCGGENDPKNLQELVQTVNASFGSQTKTCLNNLPAGFKGTLKLRMVNRDRMSKAAKKRHPKKKPCKKGKKDCP